MKINAINMLRITGDTLKSHGETVLAYSVYELANNLRLLLRGEETLAAFKEVYVGGDSDSLNIDRLLPGTEV